MKLIIDNNDGFGQQDYTPYVDAEHLPKVIRRLNRAAQMTATLAVAAPGFRVPASGGRILLQRDDGNCLFTGYLVVAPEQQYLGYGQAGPAWRYLLQAVDDSWLLDRNALPGRTPFGYRAAGDALRTITNDVLPGVFDVSGVQDLVVINQYVSHPQKSWSEHAQELAMRSRASYRAHDGRLDFQPVGSQGFVLNEQDANFSPEGLTVAQPDQLRNDITLIGELEPSTYVRDYFLGDGVTLGFYLSATPFSKSALTVFQENYTGPQLAPTLWSVGDPNQKVLVRNGQLLVNGGPATISYVEQLELAGGMTLQHGQATFNAPSSGILGGLYSGGLTGSNCIAGFQISPSGSNSVIQALLNGVPMGPTITTKPGHEYGFVTQLFSNEDHRVHQTYLSSVHAAGNGRGGDQIAGALHVVLEVHDIDPNNPGTWAVPSTVLFDEVLPTSPGFATYASINATNLSISLAYTRLQHVVDAEVRSMVPGNAFRTRLSGQLADGGECYVSSAGQLRFYPPYPPQPGEQVIVSYRSSVRAMARVQDPASVAAHAKGSDSGRRSCVKRLKWPTAPTSTDCENAGFALLDDTVQPAWMGEYRVLSDFLPTSDVLPGNAVQVLAPARGANFAAIVREIDVEVVSLDDDRSQYAIRFSNDVAASLAFEFANMILPEPLTTVLTAAGPSSSLYLAPLSGAQVTGATSTQISVDTGCQPPTGGGFEVRRTDGGWGMGSNGNLAGQFNTQTFNLPRISRVQSYYLRQYDASSPAKYSRDSILLHVDYPL
jgi:hypothetical protein